MSEMHTLKGKISTRTVWLNGILLSPRRSQKVYNHSPDGFNWGYGGSGPSQLASAIVLELTGNSNGYQNFKWNFIARLPQTDFEEEFSLVDTQIQKG